MPYEFYAYLDGSERAGSGRKARVGRPPRDRKKIGAARKAARRNR